jgi:hypothetical protein
MNDILICIRSNNRALVMGETLRGKRWIMDNMIPVDGVVWITHEAIEDLVVLIKENELHVETIR